jgi:hypothetical protein
VPHERYCCQKSTLNKLEIVLQRKGYGALGGDLRNHSFPANVLADE